MAICDSSAGGGGGSWCEREWARGSPVGFWGLGGHQPRLHGEERRARPGLSCPLEKQASLGSGKERLAPAAAPTPKLQRPPAFPRPASLSPWILGPALLSAQICFVRSPTGATLFAGLQLSAAREVSPVPGLESPPMPSHPASTHLWVYVSLCLLHAALRRGGRAPRHSDAGQRGVKEPLE